MEHLSSFARAFAPVLSTAISSHLERSRELGWSGEASAFPEYVGALAAAGGKRLRPFMAWTMYEAGGGEDARVLEGLAALELFHLFALLHDDIIDQGTLRHGLPTAHVAFTMPPHGLPARTASSIALLVGDLVLSWADRQWDALPETIEAGWRRAAVAEYRSMIDEVVAGQALDVVLTASAEARPETIDRKNELKTASYTFVRPMRIGAALAGRTDLHAFCDAFGAPVGRAFQTRDDLLDATAPASQVGKTAFADVGEGQHTMLTAHVFAHGTEAQLALLRGALGRGRPDQAAAAELRRAFGEAGAFAAAEARIADDLARAREALRSARLPAASVSKLEALCDYLATRPA